MKNTGSRKLLNLELLNNLVALYLHHSYKKRFKFVKSSK